MTMVRRVAGGSATKSAGAAARGGRRDSGAAPLRLAQHHHRGLARGTSARGQTPIRNRVTGTLALV
eukprot:3930729-Rhodomonas_salina.4